LRLRAWRWPAFALALGLVLVAALLPLGRLLWEAAEGPSMARRTDGAGWSERLPLLAEALRRSFRQALERARSDLGNSLAWGAAAAAACLPVALVLGHALERARRRAVGRTLELLVVLPFAAPAILFAIGEIVLWNRPATARFYDGPGMVILLLAGRYLPFAVLVVSGAVAALDRTLEEAGASAGAGPVERLARIVTPLLASALVGAFVLVFVFSVRELDAVLLIPSANQTALFRIYNGVHFGRDAYVAALALLVAFSVLLPGLLWTLFARRRLELLP
jgi:iron(III) transport system permease protein